MSKVLGIIAEYNPLHNGHVYHFNNIKSDLKIDFSSWENLSAFGNY